MCESTRSCTINQDSGLGTAFTATHEMAHSMGVMHDGDRNTCYNRQVRFNINSQAVGLDSWVQSALKSILRGDPIFESAAWFFISILKVIFTSILEIKIHEKNSLTPKKFHFRWLQISRFFSIIFLLQVWRLSRNHKKPWSLKILRGWAI